MNLSTDAAATTMDAPLRARDPMPDHSQHPPHPSTRLPHLGTYRRVLPVSIERLYENAIDWAHLPYVHASSFAAIECLAAGADGFRARLTSAEGGESVIELALDRRLRRWITRTVSGRNSGAEIWTHAFAIERRRTDIVVDFFGPDVPDDARARVAAAYVALYTRLYDEDVAMMTERQRQLDRRIETMHASTLDLGSLAALKLPLEVEFQGRSFVVTRLDASTLACYAARCPHQLGPLPPQPDADGQVVCPWHGYRFSVETGACLSGQPCRLPSAPRIEIDGSGNVTLSM